jgi:hypothetical protein
MSRTRAHRPYWVVENDEGAEIYHNHRFLGQPVYGPNRRKRGENGRFLRQMVDVTVPAYRIISYTWDSDEQNLWPKKYTLAQINEARKMRDAGESWAPIVIGQEMGYVYERKLLGHVPDHCVIGPNTKRSNHRVSDTEVTCSPTLSQRQHATTNVFGRYRRSQVFRNLDNRARRTHERGELGRNVKAFNSGGDVDDLDFEANQPLDHWYLD